MDIKLEYYGTVENGVLKLTNRRQFESDLQQFEGKQIHITLNRKKKGRSNQQNRFFHGVVIPIIKHALLDLGWEEARSDEWVKDYLKYNCLTKEYTSTQGEITTSLGKTSGLSTSEFMDLISDVQQWAAEKLGCYVPDPGEVMELEFN